MYTAEVARNSVVPVSRVSLKTSTLSDTFSCSLCALFFRPCGTFLSKGLSHNTFSMHAVWVVPKPSADVVVTVALCGLSLDGLSTTPDDGKMFEVVSFFEDDDEWSQIVVANVDVVIRPCGREERLAHWGGLQRSSLTCRAHSSSSLYYFAYPFTSEHDTLSESVVRSPGTR